jgi:hypothetical protein
MPRSADTTLRAQYLDGCTDVIGEIDGVLMAAKFLA